MTRLLATTAFAVLIAQGSAFAASTSSTNETTGAGSSATQAPANLPQEIKSQLKDDGFTDVKVMPGSYVVTAKDKGGNPVTMFIGPHSMTMVKAIDGDQTTGSAAVADDQDAASENK